MLNFFMRPPPLLVAIALSTLITAPSFSETTAERQVTIGGASAKIQIAETMQALIKGLSKRDSLAIDSGLLLIFPPKIKPCLWMKNTWIPLSVAFFDQNKKIVKVIERMEPNSEAIHCADQRAVFAVEMNSGWFEDNDISVGDQLEGIELPISAR